MTYFWTFVVSFILGAFFANWANSKTIEDLYNQVTFLQKELAKHIE